MANDTMRISTEDVVEFYDEFSGKLLRDYVYGNARIRAAIDKVSSVIDTNTKSILDIGCGIGASAFEYSQRHPHVRVLGVDISPRNIEVAVALFGSDRCTFEVKDITTRDVGDQYDVIALLDVYEHIPRDEWPKFNISLGEWLRNNGTLVLACPSPLHQRWLAENKPDGLQVIDETVNVEDLVRLASEIGATITDLRWVSVWRTHDYIHAVMSREPKYEPLAPPVRSRLPLLTRVWNRLIRLGKVQQEDIEKRRLRVGKKLGINL